MIFENILTFWVLPSLIIFLLLGRSGDWLKSPDYEFYTKENWIEIILLSIVWPFGLGVIIGMTIFNQLPRIPKPSFNWLVKQRKFWKK